MLSGSFWCIGSDPGNASIMRWPSSSSNELGPEPWHTIRLWGNLCDRYAASTWLMVLYLGLLEVLWVTHDIRIWLWTSADFNGDEHSVKIMANLWTRVWSFVLLANSDKTEDWWGQVDRKTDRGVCMQKDGQGQKDRRTDMVIPVSLVNFQFSLQKLYCCIKTMVYHVA